MERATDILKCVVESRRARDYILHIYRIDFVIKMLVINSVSAK